MHKKLAIDKIKEEVSWVIYPQFIFSPSQPIETRSEIAKLAGRFMTSSQWSLWLDDSVFRVTAPIRCTDAAERLLGGFNGTLASRGGYCHHSLHA